MHCKNIKLLINNYTICHSRLYLWLDYSPALRSNRLVYAQLFRGHVLHGKYRLDRILLVIDRVVCTVLISNIHLPVAIVVVFLMFRLLIANLARLFLRRLRERAHNALYLGHYSRQQ